MVAKNFPKLEKQIAKKGQQDAKFIAEQLERTEKARQIVRRFEEAKKKREQYVEIWQDVANYVLPYRGGFL